MELLVVSMMDKGGREGGAEPCCCVDAEILASWTRDGEDGEDVAGTSCGLVVEWLEVVTRGEGDGGQSGDLDAPICIPCRMIWTSSSRLADGFGSADPCAGDGVSGDGSSIVEGCFEKSEVGIGCVVVHVSGP